MNFEFSEEQLMLREQARGFLSQESPPSVTRSVLDGDTYFDANLWQKVAEMGWTATAIPEEYGGLGLGYYELAIIAEELGRSVAPIPFSSSVYLATEAIMAFGSSAQKNKWLPGLASGEVIGTLALSERSGRTTAENLSVAFDDGVVSGTKTPVADGMIANIAITVCKASPGNVRIALIDLDQNAVDRSTITTLDPSRGHGKIIFTDTPAEVLGDGEVSWSALEALLDRAAVLIAWEQLGVADMALEQACDYAKQRFAFGRAIGSFQAIKHKLAGMYVKNSLARSNAYHGVWALASDSDSLQLAASTARVASTQASLFAAQENIQTHGGMGFTWEFDCQFYYRRAKMLSLALGSERHWQNRLVSALQESNANAA